MKHKQQQPVGPTLDLRDYFASCALQALIHAQIKLSENGMNTSDEAVAMDAYAVADAMLAEKAKKK